ncbi:MAG: heparinase II/III family protein [Clostridia bacterium]|nr:heparinase II/III family protein [Clostridia bacterium]
MFREFLDENDIRALLSAPGAYRPFPRRQERALWMGLAQEKREALLAWGEEAAQGYPMLTATQFLAFSRTGSRLAYETPYFDRRVKLMGAVLAECMANDGTYLDSVIDGMWCICEESAWMVSAHNGSDHPGQRPMNERPLPDVTNPYVDLFAAQTAAALADMLYLLEDKLDAVSPLIARRVRAEIERRVIRPFMTHDDFWWMGMIRRDVCNWTPWILSNVIEVLLLLERDAQRRAEGIARAMRMLDSYLAVMPADGGCDEGAGYFNMAGAALFDCLESLYMATDGHVSFYHEPLIRNIAAFPLKAHVDGPYFLNFADCDVQPQLDGERIYRFGVRTDNAALASLGAWLYERREHACSVRPVDTPQMSRVLQALFADIPRGMMQEPPAHCALPDLQVFSWRESGLYVAIKGGHNGENHNHNDVGSFIVYADGQPQIVDMGNKVYTALTFGPQRYTLDNTRARNHNIPLVGGFEQAAGREHAARDVRAHEHGVRMDISGAYPAEAGVQALQRELTMEDGRIRLTDRIGLAGEQRVTWVFMLRRNPSLTPGEVRLGPITLRHDPALAQSVEEMPVTDERMRRNFPGSFWRLTLEAVPAASHEQTFLITRS